MSAVPHPRYEAANIDRARLYITNLPSSKIQKYDLRLSLYTLFSTYGPVLDVVAMKTMKMRGQAHVVFRDAQTATQAMRALQGFEFFGYEMVGRPLRGFCVREWKANGTALGHTIRQVEVGHDCEAGWHVPQAGCGSGGGHGDGAAAEYLQCAAVGGIYGGGWGAGHDGRGAPT